MFVEKDSIKFKYRTGGEIDSIDMTFSNHISNFSGNSLNTQNNLVSNSFLQKRNGLQNFREPFEYQEMKNSGSPHVQMDFLETQNILIIQLIFNFGKMEKNIVLYFKVILQINQ